MRKFKSVYSPLLLGAFFICITTSNSEAAEPKPFSKEQMEAKQRAVTELVKGVEGTIVDESATREEKCTAIGFLYGHAYAEYAAATDSTSLIKAGMKIGKMNAKSEQEDCPSFVQHSDDA